MTDIVNPASAARATHLVCLVFLNASNWFIRCHNEVIL
jgi:hypothetical protein